MLYIKRSHIITYGELTLEEIDQFVCYVQAGLITVSQRCLDDLQWQRQRCNSRAEVDRLRPKLPKDGEYGKRWHTEDPKIIKVQALFEYESYSGRWECWRSACCCGSFSFNRSAGKVMVSILHLMLL